MGSRHSLGGRKQDTPHGQLGHAWRLSVGVHKVHLKRVGLPVQRVLAGGVEVELQQVKSQPVHHQVRLTAQGLHLPQGTQGTQRNQDRQRTSTAWGQAGENMKDRPPHIHSMRGHVRDSGDVNRRMRRSVPACLRACVPAEEGGTAIRVLSMGTSQEDHRGYYT